MKWSEYWDALTKRNPALNDGTTKMTITVDSFQRSMKQAFEQGEVQGRKNAQSGDKVKSMFGGFGF